MAGLQYESYLWPAYVHLHQQAYVCSVRGRRPLDPAGGLGVGKIRNLPLSESVILKYHEFRSYHRRCGCRRKWMGYGM